MNGMAQSCHDPEFDVTVFVMEFRRLQTTDETLEGCRPQVGRARDSGSLELLESGGFPFAFPETV
jgi:hypothetical protein